MIDIRYSLNPFFAAVRAHRKAMGLTAANVARTIGRRRGWMSETETKTTNGTPLGALALYAQAHDVEFGVYYVIDGEYVTIELTEMDEPQTGADAEAPFFLSSTTAELPDDLRPFRETDPQP